MEAETLISVEEYLNTSYHPDCDFVDGHVLERNWGERTHSRTQGNAIVYLARRSEELGVEVFQDCVFEFRRRELGSRISQL